MLTPICNGLGSNSLLVVPYYVSKLVSDMCVLTADTVVITTEIWRYAHDYWGLPLSSLSRSPANLAKISQRMCQSSA